MRLQTRGRLFSFKNQLNVLGPNVLHVGFLKCKLKLRIFVFFFLSEDTGGGFREC